MKKKLLKIRSICFRVICILQTSKRHISNCIINGFCKFNGKEIFRKNVNFNGCKIYGKGVVSFGDNFHSASGLKILTSFHNYSGESIPYDKSVITKKVFIEDNVWVGMDVIILGGVTIGEGAIIQAGSVVSKSIAPLAIAGGNPAVEFKKRDHVMYYELKNNQKFL